MERLLAKGRAGCPQKGGQETERSGRKRKEEEEEAGGEGEGAPLQSLAQLRYRKRRPKQKPLARLTKQPFWGSVDFCSPRFRRVPQVTSPHSPFLLFLLLLLLCGFPNPQNRKN